MPQSIAGPLQDCYFLSFGFPSPTSMTQVSFLQMTPSLGQMMEKAQTLNIDIVFRGGRRFPPTIHGYPDLVSSLSPPGRFFSARDKPGRRFPFYFFLGLVINPPSRAFQGNLQIPKKILTATHIPFFFSELSPFHCVLPHTPLQCPSLVRFFCQSIL